MSADAENSKPTRKSRPDVGIYRPGSGPLRKTTSNVENIKPVEVATTSKLNVDCDLAKKIESVSLKENDRKVEKSKRTEAALYVPKKRTITNDQNSLIVSNPKELSQTQQGKSSEKQLSNVNPNGTKDSATKQHESKESNVWQKNYVESVEKVSEHKEEIKSEHDGHHSKIHTSSERKSVEPAKSSNMKSDLKNKSGNSNKKTYKKEDKRDINKRVPVSDGFQNPKIQDARIGSRKSSEKNIVYEEANGDCMEFRNQRKKRTRHSGHQSPEQNPQDPDLNWEDVGMQSNQRRNRSRSRSRHSSVGSRTSSMQGGRAMSPSLYLRPGSAVTPPGTPLKRQSSEPPIQIQTIHSKNPHTFDRQFKEPDGEPFSRPDAKPPSGRKVERPSLPINYHSLPPRFKKKYEGERSQRSSSPLSAPKQSSPCTYTEPKLVSVQAPTVAQAEDWDGTSLTFVSSCSVKPSEQQTFTGTVPTPNPRSSWNAPSPKPGRGRGRGQNNYQQLTSREMAMIEDDVDALLVRARSQDSLTGDRFSLERKTSYTESRSSTPSSSDHYPGHHPPATLQPLEEKGGSHAKLDWSEEMDLEDQKTEKSSTEWKEEFRPTTIPMDKIIFASRDIRYRDKPEQGYFVICNSSSESEKSSMKQPAEATSKTLQNVGRPLLGQGRLQQSVTKDEHSPMNIPGLIHLNPQIPQPWQSSDRPKGGLIVLPPSQAPPRQSDKRHFTPEVARDYRRPPSQRMLYDPANPNRPTSVATRDIEPPPFHPTEPPPGMQRFPETIPSVQVNYPPTDHGLGPSKPSWYDHNTESFRSCKCDPQLLINIRNADAELSYLAQSVLILKHWNRIQCIRQFLLRALETLLARDLRFSQMENVEQHIWKIAFHNIIEALRKGMADEADLKDQFKSTLFRLIDEGTVYFESLLDLLQRTYGFDLEQYLEPQPYPLSGLGFIGLALISAQKIFIFLGDLARYKEMASETSNYGKAKSWYSKANLANPKNGRPYNQLAILALYARRKLDAVYLYMRSIMASNPFQSARESLMSLFDENRKKFELQERKRRELKAAKRKENTLLSETKEEFGGSKKYSGVRKEIWIHPLGGKRTHRTTSQDMIKASNSDDEELAALQSVEVNKRFVTSYLNVQGKLYNKVGMETFVESSIQMLREFRALLQHSPLPVNQMRLLQLLALNMFAIFNTKLKDTRMEGGYRSALQEYALAVSLEMFNVILERCNALLKEQLESPPPPSFTNRLLGEDLQIILPAVKVWCDWLLCHSSIWNPPPTSNDFHVGPPGTPWTRFAILINFLRKINVNVVQLSDQPLPGYEVVKLAEDIALCGFTPLMQNVQEPVYSPKTSDMDLAADRVRIERLLYVGRDFLCGLDPPVLKLQFTGPSTSEYISVVESLACSRNETRSDTPSSWTEEVEGEVVESYSEDEDEGVVGDAEDGSLAAGEIRQLRQKKEELEKQHLDRERRKQRLKTILGERVQVELEIRPKFLVADTNCYIDHLPAIRRLTQDRYYTLIVPLVVLNELDGLTRSRLASEAKSALDFLREKNPHVRYVTSKGAPLPTMAFTMEESDDQQAATNDDRILQCCLSLSHDKGAEDESTDAVRRLRRETVLLTDDRNLRVKALSRDVPVRDLPSFLAWTTNSMA